MKIAISQILIEDQDKKATEKRIVNLLDKINTNPDWIIFPETTLTGFCEDLSKIQTEDKDIEFFQKISIKWKCYVTFGAVIDRENLAFTLNHEGREVCRYSKIHLFSPMREHLVYTAGTKTVSFTIGPVRIMPFVCYDLRFPYLFWNNAQYTDVFVVIANWPEVRIEHWKNLLLARAIENQSYLIGVNRVGSSKYYKYGGNSMVVDPWGKCIMSCSNKEEIQIIEIDPDLVKKTRKEFPVFRDRKDKDFVLPFFR